MTTAPREVTEGRFSRIREEQGEIYWETSTDGSEWTWRFQAASPFPVTALRPKIGAYKWTGAPLTIRFASYNP